MSDDSGRYIGLAVLTFFLPFIGGWFLIRPDVPTSFRYPAMIWCGIVGLYAIGNSFTSSGFVGIIVAIFCLAPLALYFKSNYKKQKADEAQQQRMRDKQIEELLRTPMKTYKDAELEELEKKYKA